ncbi:MAG: urease accessory protein UreE [Rhodospirillaceae bacterium]|nr:urease accessory protein UreE [Rhodospirillaceae bacterium]
MPPARAGSVAHPGDWPAAEAADAVTLPFDLRYRRRIRLTTDAGVAVLLDLDHAVALAEGDGLRLDGGGWIAVKAAPEPLLEVRAVDALHVARLAWHLGNRHVPCEVQADRLLIRPDHVLADMLCRLGASVTAVSAPFQPEGGAYGGGHGHVHADSDADGGH